MEIDEIERCYSGKRFCSQQILPSLLPLPRPLQTLDILYNYCLEKALEEND